LPGETYRFHHIHVFCSDLDATERWFIDAFDAQVAERRNSRGTPQTILMLGQLQLMLRPRRPDESLDPSVSTHFGIDHFGLGVDDLDAVAADLRRRGIPLEVEPMEWRPGLRIAFVRGPDDVRIELLEHAAPRG